MPRESNLKRRERSEDGRQLPNLMFAELDGLLGYLLRRAQGAMHRDFMAAVASFELTQKQAATLWLIHANAGVSQAEVAAALGMDRATMMAVTDRLEDRDFVIRKRSSVDRRRQDLYLTPAGQAILREVQDAHRRARREVPRHVLVVRTRIAARCTQAIPESRLIPCRGFGPNKVQRCLPSRTRRARWRAGACRRSTILPSIPSRPMCAPGCPRRWTDPGRIAAIRAVILICEGSTFFSGADIGEFSGPPREVEYRLLFNALEALDVPVIAAMHGTVMGGGLEIALACHYRVAAPATRFALPEVTLGHHSRAPAARSACRGSSAPTRRSTSSCRAKPVDAPAGHRAWASSTRSSKATCARRARAMRAICRRGQGTASYGRNDRRSGDRRPRRHVRTHARAGAARLYPNRSRRSGRRRCRAQGRAFAVRRRPGIRDHARQRVQEHRRIDAARCTCSSPSATAARVPGLPEDVAGASPCKLPA